MIDWQSGSMWSGLYQVLHLKQVDSSSWLPQHNKTTTHLMHLRVAEQHLMPWWHGGECHCGRSNCNILHCKLMKAKRTADCSNCVCPPTPWHAWATLRSCSLLEPFPRKWESDNNSIRIELSEMSNGCISYTAFFLALCSWIAANILVVILGVLCFLLILRGLCLTFLRPRRHHLPSAHHAWWREPHKDINHVKKEENARTDETSGHW